MTVGTRVRFGIFVALLAAGVGVLVWVPVPDPGSIEAWAAEAGAWLPVAFVAGYAAATLFLLPKNVLSAAAGLIFGLTAGVALVWVGAMLGAFVSFWIGRGLGRDGVRWIAGCHLDRLDGLVARHGIAAVLLARLVPVVPFTAVNYGSGLTAVSFPAYVLATALGIIPGTVAYVAVGAFGTDPGSWPFLLAAGSLGALTLGGAFYVRRRQTQE